MSTIPNRDFGTFTSGIVTDQHRAGNLIARLVSELCRPPVEGGSRVLYLRALSLKRAVMHWPEEHPDESARRAVFAEVRTVQDEARDLRRLSVSRRLNSGEGRGDD